MPTQPLAYSALVGLFLINACGSEIPAGPQQDGPSLTMLANTWRTRAPMPVGLLDHSAAVVPNAAGVQILYVMGGVRTVGAVQDRVKNVYAYNPVTNTWTEKAPMPAARGRMNGAVVINGKIHVTGGYSTAGRPTNTHFVYNPVTNTWATKAALPNITAAGVSANLGNKLHVLYGECWDCEGATSNIVPRQFRYDPGTNAWRRLKGSPHKHVLAAAGVINGKWYVAGGGGSNRDLDVYTPSTNTWVTKASLPSVQLASAGAVLGKKLYVIGGSQTPTLVRAYNPATNTWATRASMPTGRGFLAAAKLVRSGNAVLHALGGQNETTRELATNEEYDD
jgi:N-acetylneuraminic acid mutarotase